MSRNFRSAVAIYLLCLCSLAFPAFGEQEYERSEDPTHLEDVKVTGDWLGTPTPETVRLYPGGRSVVTDEALHKTAARSAEEVLGRMPGVKVLDETGTGVLPNISVRGLNPLRTGRSSVLVDGVPALLAPYVHPSLSLFPVTLESLEAIDVVRGGAAVHYGPNNVGGVINFITRPIPLKPSTTLKQSLTFAENGNTLSDTYLRTGGYVRDNLGLQLQFNTTQGESFRDHSENEIYNVIVDADWFIDDNRELKLRLQHYNVDAELPGALTPEAYKDDREQSQRPFDDFSADTTRGSVVYNQILRDGSEFNWVNFVNKSRREFTFSIPFDPSAAPTAVQDTPRDLLVLGTEPRYTFGFNSGLVSHKVTVGTRFVDEDVDYEVDRFTLATQAVSKPRFWKFDTEAWAFYASDTLSLFGRRLEITPGLRYESVEMDFRDALNNTTQSHDFDELLPGINIGYRFSESLFLFADAQRSLSPPETSQVTRGGDVGAERAWNYEVGARLSPFAGVDTSLTLFRIDFRDQIEFDSGTSTYVNLGKTLHQGVEAELSWSPRVLNGTRFEAGYTYLDTEQRSGANEGNRLPYASRHKVNLAWYQQLGAYDVNINGLYTSSAFSDAANTEDEDATGRVGELPSYWLWNAQVSRELLRRDDRVLSASLAVNNVFDEDYYFRGVDVSPEGRVPAPGRSFLVSMQMDF